MTRKVFRIEYEFTSTKADGDAYVRHLDIVANDVASAMSVARIEGFRAFGAQFNDNCIDWRYTP